MGDAIPRHGHAEHAVDQAERLAHQAQVPDESEAHVCGGIRTVTEEHLVVLPVRSLPACARFESVLSMKLLIHILDGLIRPGKVQLVDGPELEVVHLRVTAMWVFDALGGGNRCKGRLACVVCQPSRARHLRVLVLRSPCGEIHIRAGDSLSGFQVGMVVAMRLWSDHFMEERDAMSEGITHHEDDFDLPVS